MATSDILYILMARYVYLNGHKCQLCTHMAIYCIIFGHKFGWIMIGRIKEIARLDKSKSHDQSDFIAIYGRRRVGKTYLIREYFNYKFDFYLTGLANATKDQQLLNFHHSLLRQGTIHYDHAPDTWLEAFQRLISHIELITDPRKKVIFLDEIPWLDTVKSDFLIGLEHFWNHWASFRKDIILITCGSAASWMIHELINNHGGLHNRVTVRMKIEPFQLKEVELMLRDRNHVLDRYQILQIYMVTGGIPFYLDGLDPGKSAAQNIEEACFREGGFLRQEYKILFASLFKKYQHHEAVVKALASKTKGLTRKEVIVKTGMKSGGGLTRVLNELDESGFISSYTPFQLKSRNTIYRLSDFYTLFYHKFIKESNSYDEGMWINSIESPSYRAWAGYSFEQVCLTHILQIKKALGISGIASKASTWFSRSSEEGAQIDLLIDRKDQVVNICEIKYSIHPYEITKSYNEKLRNKLAVFQKETKTRKALFLTMITTYGLKKNIHSSMIQNEITMDDLFNG